jgi:hypothetical protein
MDTWACEGTVELQDKRVRIDGHEAPEPRIVAYEAGLTNRSSNGGLPYKREGGGVPITNGYLRGDTKPNTSGLERFRRPLRSGFRSGMYGLRVNPESVCPRLAAFHQTAPVDLQNRSLPLGVGRI